MLLVYGVEAESRDACLQACSAESEQFVDSLRAEGRLHAAALLHPTSTATSLRIRDGKRIVTDGPFAETTEQLGGCYLVDAANLDDALDIAARIAASRSGTVEIRPVNDQTDPDELHNAVAAINCCGQE
jgi:hypothetical protein